MTTYTREQAMNPAPRKLDEVRKTLENAKAKGADKSFARLMLRHGRMTDDARAYVAAYK